MAGQGSNPNTPRPTTGRMLGLGGTASLQPPQSQPRTPGSRNSVASSWVEVTPGTATSQLAGLLSSKSDPIGNLNDKLPVSPAVTLNEFVEQCSHLIEGVDPRRHLFPERRSIRIPKTQLSCTPSQLFEAWRMLNQRERTGLRGGLQASSAGIGKTFICLTALLLRARLFSSALLVKEFWSLSPTSPNRRSHGNHLPSTARGTGLKCPSQGQGDIVCYCVPTSKARSFVDHAVAPRGCALIQAPYSVIPQWIAAFQTANLDPAAYNLVISYPDTPIRLKRNFTQIIQSLSQPAIRGSHQALETYIFVSSHTNERVLETFTVDTSVQIGLHLSDESHFAMRLESRAMAISDAQAKTGDGLDLWLVSATPIRVLEDFELPMQIFSGSSDLARCTAMADLVTAHATARSSNKDMETFLRHWSRVFDSHLVRRNTLDSQFNGRSITGLRITKPQKIWLETPQQHFEHVQTVAHLARNAIREKASVAAANNEVFDPNYASGVDARLHFVSLFPGAAGLIARGELNIDEEYVRKLIGAINVPNKLKVENIESFQKHLEEAVRGSPKLDFIMAEIGRMRADKEERDPIPAPQTTLHSDNLSLKKMVIITPTLGTAVFLYNWILKRMPLLNPICFHNIARTGDREAALNSFQSLTSRKNARHSYVFITPFSIGGTGLNLQSANYQIFVSPPQTIDMETQGFARTNRTGQRLPLHHSILITVDNAADKINVASYGGRSIRGDPFGDMRRDLVLAAPNGSKKIERLTDWGYKVRPWDPFFEPFAELYPGAIEESECHGVEISHSSVTTYLDTLAYFDAASVAGDTIAVSEAWNFRDRRPRHEKLALRDMLLALWVHELDRPARGLKCFVYITVKEEALRRDLWPQVYRMMGRRLTRDLLLRRESQRPDEVEAFYILLENAPFCIGIQKMLDEYAEFSGIAIKSFEFHPNVDDYFEDPEPSFDFKIMLT